MSTINNALSEFRSSGQIHLHDLDGGDLDIDLTAQGHYVAHIDGPDFEDEPRTVHNLDRLTCESLIRDHYVSRFVFWIEDDV